MTTLTTTKPAARIKFGTGHLLIDRWAWGIFACDYRILRRSGVDPRTARTTLTRTAGLIGLAARQER